MLGSDARVKDVIAELQQFDPELLVCFHATEDGDLFQFACLDVDGTCSEDEPEVLRITFTDDLEEPIA